MNIRFELTSRLAELTGFQDESIEIAAGQTLRDALRRLERKLMRGPGACLVEDGHLHPSVLVVVNESACLRGDASIALRDGETIRLMLPIAGG